MNRSTLFLFAVLLVVVCVDARVRLIGKPNQVYAFISARSVDDGFLSVSPMGDNVFNITFAENPTSVTVFGHQPPCSGCNGGNTADFFTFDITYDSNTFSASLSGKGCFCANPVTCADIPIANYGVYTTASCEWDDQYSFPFSVIVEP